MSRSNGTAGAHTWRATWLIWFATSSSPPAFLAKVLHTACAICRERVFKSLSLYELARRFWQQHDYDRTILAIEQALAHKLFPYTDAEMLERWQRRLVRPGLAFKRPKLELADALTLKANTLYELGKRDRSIEHLYQTLEAVQLSAALMHTCQVREGLATAHGSLRQTREAACSCFSQLRLLGYRHTGETARCSRTNTQVYQ